jgi:hypothetical protein
LLAGGSGKPAGFRGVAQARVMHSFSEPTMFTTGSSLSKQAQQASCEASIHHAISILRNKLQAEAFAAHEHTHG